MGRFSDSAAARYVRQRRSGVEPDDVAGAAANRVAAEIAAIGELPADQQVDSFLRYALEREQVVDIAYSESRIAAMLDALPVDDAVRDVVRRAVLWPSHSVYPSTDSRRSRLFMQWHRSGIVSAMSGTRARAACFVVCQRLTRFYRVLSVICPRAARSCFRPPTSLNTRCDILARQLFWPLDRRDSDVWYGIWGLGIACESRVELC